MRVFLLTLSLLLIHVVAYTQESNISGRITDLNGIGIEGVNIIIKQGQKVFASDKMGYFSFQWSDQDTLQFTLRHLNYQTRELKLLINDQDQLLEIVLEEKIKSLEQVEILGSRDYLLREQPSLIQLDPVSAKMLPSPFNEFNRILVSLPGVVSNNELSASYSVRGGNFDENLVYVNDMLIYRPFLIRAGQQEGLSFVNPDLVESVQFSSGGWQPKYGDKLSSNLNITYKKPQEFGGSVSLGLLGGAVHLEGASKNDRLSFLVGARHKSSQYLLRTLETKGEYLPRFTDVQSYLNYRFKNGKTEIGLLNAYARNRYLVNPQTRETSFGTLFTEVLRFLVAFDGVELMEYDTWQSGLKLSHQFNPQLYSTLTMSGWITREREYFEVEGAYRLCDVNKDLNSDQFDRCSALRGIGSNYRSARNRLTAQIFNIENRNEIEIRPGIDIEFGAGYALENIDDYIHEYTFLDSIDYVINNDLITTDQEITSHRLTAYAQNSLQFNSRHTITYGVRFNYWTYNRQLLVSPRLQYAYQPVNNPNLLFNFAAGLYQQPPFYRELRDKSGSLNQVQAQKAVHFIGGVDYNLSIWNRPFKLTAEAYYKHLTHLNPYDVDNVRVRYFANNDAEGYATGLDFRLSGEFIPGAVSWFSLGLLQTRENLLNDESGYIRRPSDQTLNFAINFEDHIPNDPSIRMNLSFFLGSGLPFGPPGNQQYRNAFNGPIYRRVDVGFSKMLIFNSNKNLFNSIWIGAEILNLFGSENVISYSWVNDIFSQQFAIPNTLSARFLNIKMIVKY